MEGVQNEKRINRAVIKRTKAKDNQRVSGYSNQRSVRSILFIMIACFAGVALCGFDSTSPAGDFWSRLFMGLPFAEFYASVVQGVFELRAVLSVVTMFLGIGFTELLMGPLTSLINSIDNKATGTVLYVILFLAVFVLCTFVFSLVTEMSWGVSSILVSIFHLFPEIITVIVTDILAFTTFASLCSDDPAFQWAFIPTLIILVAWIIVAEWLIDKVNSKISSWAIKKKANPTEVVKGGVKIVQLIFLFLTSTTSVALIYIMCLMNYEDTDDILMNIVLGLPFVKELATGTKIIGYFQWDQIGSFVILFAMLFLFCIVSGVVHGSPIKYISITLVGWPFLEGLIMVLIIGGYGLINAIPMMGQVTQGLFSMILIYVIFMVLLLLFLTHQGFFFGCLIQAAVLTGFMVFIQQMGFILRPEQDFEKILLIAVGVIGVGFMMNVIYSIVAWFGLMKKKG